MIELRDYQQEQINRTRAALRTSRRVVLQLPTGGGKTAMAAFMAGTALRKNLRVWFICHRDFLLHQTSGTFSEIGIPHDFIAAGRRYNRFYRCHIVSVDTVKRRLHLVDPPDLVIWDECHHCAAAGWRKVFNGIGNPYHIGLTATPVRLDGKGLDNLFDELVPGPSVADLIEQGFLSDYRAFAPTTPDLDGVATRAGDYARDQLAGVMDTNAIVGDLVKHYRNMAMGRRALYFAVSIHHSERIAAMFNANGIPALHLDGTTPTDERIAAAQAFARGEVKVLSNVELFGEGYDLAAQAGMDVTIDSVGLARPTQSLSLHLQQIGRALRPKDHPAVILDHAGNISRHGLPDQEREWSLQGRDKKKKKQEDDPHVRQCPECFGMHAVHHKTCPYCGHVYQTEGRTLDEVDGDLQEIDVKQARMSRKMEEWKCESVKDLIALGRRRGYRNPEKWAAHVWTARQQRGQRKVDGQMEFYMGSRGVR